jgi:hypothetical protein
MWQTYTPEGWLLVLRRNESGWNATCLSRSAQGQTAEEAIRGALGVESPSGNPQLETWIADHVAELDREGA